MKRIDYKGPDEKYVEMRVSSSQESLAICERDAGSVAVSVERAGFRAKLSKIRILAWLNNLLRIPGRVRQIFFRVEELHNMQNSRFDYLHQRMEDQVAFLRKNMDIQFAALQQQNVDTQKQNTNIQKQIDSTQSLIDNTRNQIDDIKHQLVKQIADMSNAQAVQYSDIQRLARIPKTVSAIDDLAIVFLDDFIIGVLKKELRMLTCLSYYGYLEPGSVKVFRSLIKSGMRVLDIGANNGVYTLIAARLVGAEGHVWSVEPTPELIPVIETNIWMNHFKEANIVTVCPVAASDVNQTVKFGTSDSESGHNSMYPEYESNAIIEVEAARMDDYLGDVLSVDVIKLDVEGAEPNALRGMARIIENSPKLKIVMEWGPSNLKRNKVDPLLWLNELKSQGFSVRAIDENTGNLWEPTDEELLTVYSVNLLLEKD